MCARAHNGLLNRVVMAILVMLLVGACSAPKTFNPGDTASDEYYEYLLLRCALQADGLCSTTSGVAGTPSNQITPDAIGSSLKLWLEADVLSQGNGTAVTSWTDQSSNGFNADQGTGVEQPTFQTSAIGGQPAVRFDGSATPGNNLILGANHIFSTNDGMTFMAVARSNTEDNTESYLLDFGLNAAAGYGLSYSANSDGTNDNARLYTGDIGVVGGGEDQAPFQSTSTDNVIIVGRVKFAPASDNHQSIYINGNLLTTNTTYAITQLTAAEICEAAARGGTGPNTPSGAFCTSGGNGGPITIGGQSKTGVQAGRFFDGDIALVLVFDRALTETERQGLECYASLKYGISVSHSCF